MYVLWCFERLFLKSSSGRQRYNVLGAYSVQDTDLITIVQVVVSGVLILGKRCFEDQQGELTNRRTAICAC